MKKTEKRYTQIVELLNTKQRVDVTELSDRFHVSQVTIRKDLDHLEQQGLIIREHGFATLNNRDDMNTRLAYHYESKQEIAKLACSYVENGETILIESGSCCALLAQAIAKQKKEVTIITNSSFIADYIRKEDIHIILLGGEYQKDSQVQVGPMIRKYIENFHVNKFFIGVDGYSSKTGFTGNDYMRCEAVRDMAKQANEVIVVSESNKFEQVGLVNLLPSSEISAVFTDSDISKKAEDELIQNNVKVIKTKKAQ